MKNIISSIMQRTNLSEQESWWILQAITDQSKEQLLLSSKQELSIEHKEKIENWIQQIIIGEIPLAYLLGWVPFLDLTIKVQSPILIPRPETEEWVDLLIQKLQAHASEIKNILDIGTGSGCIALALASKLPNATVTAVDINPAALHLLQINAKLNNITNVIPLQSDLFEKLKGKAFDLIVSNPPYIDPALKQTISDNVLLWEDHRALFSQENGLWCIKQIIKQAPEFLIKNKSLPCQLVFEFDPGQETIIKELCEEQYLDCAVHKDMFGKNRTAFCSIR